MKYSLNNLIKEINKCTVKELIITIVSCAIAVLWPLGGIIIYFVSTKTNFKLYGKFALYCAIATMLAYSLKVIIGLILI